MNRKLLIVIFTFLFALGGTIDGFADEGSIIVSGRILDLDGNPIAGAAIRLEPLISVYERHLSRLDGRQPPAAAETRSGVDGYFRLEAPQAGPWTVAVSRPGYQPLSHQIVPMQGPLVLAELSLPATRDLEVTVRSAAGEPIAGARLAIQVPAPERGRRLGQGWRARAQLATTGPDGRATLPRVPGKGAVVEVVAEVEIGHPVHHRIELAPQDGDHLALELPATANRRVVLLDLRDRELPEALVLRPGALLPYGLTHEDGELYLALPPKAELPLSLYGPDLAYGQAVLEPPGGEPEESVSLRLRPAELLEGRILVTGSRTPIAGALVWSQRSGTLATADQDGRFELPTLPGSRKQVTDVGAPGYVKDIIIWYGNGGTWSEAIESLSPAARIHGQVVDTDGQPVAGAAIRPWAGAGNLDIAMGGFSSVETDRAGRFYLSPLPAGQHYDLFFFKAGYGTRHTVVHTDRGAGPIRLVLYPGRQATGRVVDPEGHGVVSAEVVWRSASSKIVHGIPDPSQQSTITDSQGAFALQDVGPGDFEIAIRGPAHIPQTVRRRIGPAEGYDLGEFVLSRGAELRGEVRELDGRPVAGAELRVSSSTFSDRRFLAQASSTADGSFLIRGLPQDVPVEIWVIKEGYALRLLQRIVVPPKEPLSIALTPVLTVEGQMVAEDGRPIRGARVELSSELMMTAPVRSYRPPSKTDHQGRFRIEDMTPGEAKLRVEASGFQDQHRDLIIPEGGLAEPLRIVLRSAGASITGSVRYPDGELVEGAAVVLRDRSGAGGKVVPPASSHITGRYHLGDIPDGSYILAARKGAGPWTTREIDVHTGTQTVDLVIQPGLTVRGRLLDSQGQPAQGAQLYLSPRPLRPGRRNDPSVTTAGDGSFTFHHLVPGTYKPRAVYQSQHRRVDPQVEITASLDDLTLRLAGGTMITGEVLGFQPDRSTHLRVALWSDDVEFNDLFGTDVRVGNDGRFRIAGVLPGSYHLLASGPQGYEGGIPVLVREGETEIEVELDLRAATLTLTGVVQLRGQPVPEIYVSLLPANDEALSRRRRKSRKAVTDAFGAFRLPRLEPGSYQVYVDEFQQELHLTMDREVTIDLPTYRMAGRVVDGSGNPVAHAEVRARRHKRPSHDGLPAPTSTGPDGSFLLSDLERATWIVTASHKSHGSITDDVAVPVQHQDPRFVLPSGGLRFTTGIQGQPPASLYALVERGSRTAFRGPISANDDGQFHLDTVPDGTWELQLFSGQTAPFRRTVTVPGDLGHLELALPSFIDAEIPELLSELRTELSLEYRGPDGEAFFGPEDFHGRIQAVAGRLTLGPLGPGEHRFTLTHPDGRQWSGSANTPAAGRARWVAP